MPSTEYLREEGQPNVTNGTNGVTVLDSEATSNLDQSEAAMEPNNAWSKTNLSKAEGSTDQLQNNETPTDITDNETTFTGKYA